METEQNKNRAKKPRWCHYVSQKFFDSLCCRLYMASELSSDFDVEKMISFLKKYVDTGIVDVEFSVTERVVFTVLQPMIDRAVRRSLLARIAARRRREAKEAAKLQTEAAESTAEAEVKAGETEEVASDCEPAESKEDLKQEKRKLRREAAAARRLEKHRKRVAQRSRAANDIPVTQSTEVS